MAVEQKSQISRRAITKGVAWSVPAFAIATAAPALAQSPLVTFVPSGYVCKYPGKVPKIDYNVKHAYFFPVTITNTSNERVRISAISGEVILDDGTKMTGDAEFWQGYPHSGGTPDADGILEGDPGQSNTWNFVVNKTGNSAMSAGTVYLTVTVLGLETGRSYEYTVELEFPETPPCDEDDFPVDEEVEPTSATTSDPEPTSATESADSGPADSSTAESEESGVQSSDDAASASTESSPSTEGTDSETGESTEDGAGATEESGKS